MMYHELADWWPVLSAPDDYAEEAGSFASVLEARSARPISTVLELGAGGGNNALHMKKRFRMTLTDVSKDMLAVSQALNPDCEHVWGDMRSLRLGRRFDAVFVHDAVGYMLTEEDLRAAMLTAFEHLSPGGPALFVPDFTSETLVAATDHGGHDSAGRSIRYLSWTHPPDTGGSTYSTDFVYVLRDSSGTRVLHETHRFGLFSRGTWVRLLREVGFEPYVVPYNHSTFHDGPRDMFCGVRP